MARDPLRTFEGWVSRDNFAVRREVIPITTERRTRPPRNRLLKALEFQGAHVWPLKWGGAEVPRVFYAHGPTVNLSLQALVENAMLRLAKLAGPHGVRIFVTADAWRYTEQLDLLERITYRVEAVTPDLVAHDLGEVTVFQNLTLAQRRALVAGERIEINPRRIVNVDGGLRAGSKVLAELVRRARGAASRRPRPAPEVAAAPETVPPAAPEPAAPTTPAAERATGSRRARTRPYVPPRTRSAGQARRPAR